MLRRKPTAITITNDDIAAFEEAYLRKIARAKYLKTGEDPEGYFRNNNNGTDNIQQNMNNERQQQDNSTSGQGAIDPNDELKPLPGDKARIVRSREERIGIGGGSAR